MEKIVNLLKKWSSGKIVFLFFMITMIVYLIMLVFTIPAVESYSSGKKLFDLSPTGYSYEYAILLLEELGTEGRYIYLYRQLPMDFIYPGLFAISYSLLLTWVFKKAYATNSKIFNFTVIPFFVGFFDYLENMGIISMINLYPEIPHKFVSISSAFTLLKSSFSIIFFILLLVGFFQILKQKINHSTTKH